MCDVLLNSMHSSERKKKKKRKEKEKEKKKANSVQRCYKCVVFC